MKKITFKSLIVGAIFNYILNKYIKSGKIKKFDQEFYNQFEGMYYHGIPVYYYLEKMNMGRCYDTSAILALAMGEESYVCRGDLNTMSSSYNERFGHGWVIKGDFVYDTTWQIICPITLYNKLFKPVKVSKRSYTQFFNDCKGISDWTIRDKEYYEKHHSLSSLLIFQVRQLEKLKLDNPTITKEEKMFIDKILKDLPDETKAPQYNYEDLNLNT